MSLNKTKYIIGQLAKTNKKNYENYVITRIWHLLNNANIKIITQQHVTTKSGRALTDLYFPQLNLHIEVDEGHHFNDDGFHTPNDLAREADIVNATNHDIRRINVATACIESINKEVDKLVIEICKKFNSEKPIPWDIDAEFNPITYINMGKISTKDNVALKNHIDVCKCFGLQLKQHQRGSARIMSLDNTIIWFPKLYSNNGWDNSISFDEKIITEKMVISGKSKFKSISDYLSHALEKNIQKRIVFAHAKNNLGETLYRFKGVYKLDIKESEKEQACIYERIATEIELPNNKLS